MASTKFDFNKSLLNSTNEPILDENQSPVSLATTLSRLIMRSNISEGTMKFFEWALDLVKKGELELDSTDQSAIKSFIEKNKEASVLMKGRLLEVFKLAA